MRRRAAGNDFAENPTAFLGRGLLALIVALAGMSMTRALGAHWSQLSERTADVTLTHLLLVIQIFCALGMLLLGALTLLGGNPPRSVLRAFPLFFGLLAAFFLTGQSFVANLLACLLDMPAAVVAVSMLPFLCHLLLEGQWAQALAATVVFALLGVQTCALVRFLIDAAALFTRQTRRWTEIPALTGLLLICLCGVVPPAFASLITAKQQNPRAVHIQLPSLPAVDPSPVLPSTYACHTLLAVRQDDLRGAAGSFLVLVTITGVTMGAAFGASRSVAHFPNDTRAAARSPGARWLRPRRVGMRDGPISQLAAMVVTELRLLVRKPDTYLPLRQPAAMVLLGVLGFLSPDMGKDPVYSFKELLGLGGVLYTVLWQMQLLCNRFGSESGTAALLFSLSIPRWRMLLGKNLALFLLLLMLDSVALAALCVVAEAPQNIPSFLLWQCLALIVITALGNIVSVLQPFSIARHDSRNREDASDGLAAAYVGIGVGAGLLLWPVAGIVGSGPWGAVMGFGYALLLYGVSLCAATVMLKRNERIMVARLDRSDK